MTRKYIPITAARAIKFGLEKTPYARKDGYRIQIVPPIQTPTPDIERLLSELPENAKKHTKACDSCSRQTPLALLRDITCCGDWLSVCIECDQKMNPEKYQPQHLLGWYRFKKDAVRRAERLNNEQPYR